MSNHSQLSAYDKGSCTEEPCEIERLTHGSVAEVGTERFVPTVTVCPESCRLLAGGATRLSETDLSRPGKG